MPKSMVIAVPTFENILPDTFKSIYDLKIPKDNFGFPLYALSFNFVRGYDCARARNTIVSNALRDKFDYILMVDSDIVLPKDLLLIYEESRASRDKDGVFLGGYLKKNNKYGLVELYKNSGIKDFTEFNQYRLSEIKSMRNQGVTRFAIKGGGFGCAILNTEDLRTLEYPWFHYQVYSKGLALSEDLWFCVNAARHDIPIWSDTRIQCGHWFKQIRYE